MRRRNDDTIAEGLVIIASKLPWWACLILAALSFLILHGIAGIKPEPITGTGTMGAFAVKQLWITLAMFGQFIMPFLFGLAAIISAVKAKKKE